MTETELKEQQSRSPASGLLAVLQREAARARKFQANEDAKQLPTTMANAFGFKAEGYEHAIKLICEAIGTANVPHERREK